MNQEQIRKHLVSQPFRPFTIHLADGRALHVPHPEFGTVGGGGRTMVWCSDSEDAHEIIDLRQITSIRITGDAA